ncbi:MAG TPA: HPr kinase/phosphatase C-terminal domain-containing protein [Rhizomicrobium sp.]
MKNIHASCVMLGRAGTAFGTPRNAGILILGKSGAGKSSLALRMIADGASLIADDRVELFARRGQLFARAPKTLAGLIEVRGVGIIKLPYKKEARVALAVRLTDTKIARLPERAFYISPEKMPQVPLISLPYDAATPARIAAAVAAFAKNLFREEVKKT